MEYGTMTAVFGSRPGHFGKAVLLRLIQEVYYSIDVPLYDLRGTLVELWSLFIDNPINNIQSGCRKSTSKRQALEDRTQKLLTLKSNSYSTVPGTTLNLESSPSRVKADEVTMPFTQYSSTIGSLSPNDY